MKKIYLGKSKIAGKGIFAGEDIKKGEFVTFLKGKLCRKEYKTKRDTYVGPHWVSVGYHTWINPAFPIRRINHSCSPNLGFKTFRKVYAMRDIKKGEELTIDYSTVDYVELWNLRCKCKSPRCRKIVR